MKQPNRSYDRLTGWSLDDVRAFMEEHEIRTFEDLSEALGVGRNRWADIAKGGPVSRTLALAMVGLSARMSGGGWKPPSRRLPSAPVVRHG